MFGSSKTHPVCRGLDVPLEADSVDSPIVTYGEGPTAINFVTRDGNWGRVTFERLDSIRVCRGEYDPYPDVRGDDWKPGDPFYWVSVVENSRWLKERYDYEKAYYGESYNFGGNVDEMLTEFSHYLFSFHDQYVEVLAAGIWFEEAEQQIGTREPGPDHPLTDLPESAITHRFEAYGITCQVRTNPKPRDDLTRHAALCSQNVLQFAAELDGSSSVSWTLTARAKDGKLKSFLRSHFGKAEETYDGISNESVIRPRIERWLGEVRTRRDEMGKK